MASDRAAVRVTSRAAARAAAPGILAAIVVIGLFLLWTLLFLGPLLELGAGLLVSRSDRSEAFALAYFLPLFFVSIALCATAWLGGVAGKRYAWAKTARAQQRVAGRAGT